VAFKEKDFLLIDYTAKVKETGDVVETTIADIAKEYNIFDKEKKYEPMLVILGEGRVVKGLEEALKQMSVGEEKTIEVPPEKAYGTRDPSKLRRMPMREFRRAGIEPFPGKVVEINGVPAVVRDVSGGRVLVDFNHPLAGKTIVYDVKVVAHLSTDEDKVKALLKRRMKPKNIDAYGIEFNREEGTITIRIPVDEMLNPDIQLAKKALARELFNYIDWCSKVIYTEIIESSEKKAKETPIKAEEKESQTQKEEVATEKTVEKEEKTTDSQ
jgi:peptidylprolyl isomerase